MNNPALVLVLLIAFLSSFGLSVFIFQALVRSLRNNSLKKRRNALMQEYSAQQDRRKRLLQITVAANLMTSYGDSIIRDKYRNRLENLLVTSGDWEIKNFSVLAQRKIGFALIGFTLSFLLLLTNNWAAAPVVLLLVFFGYLLPNIQKIGTRIIRGKYRTKLVEMLDSAGNWQQQDYLVLLRKKITYAFFGFLAAYFYLVAKSGQFISVPWALALVAIGFFIPDLLLQNRVSKRKIAIADSLPDAIDMLQMCVAAGLALPAAMSKVSESQSGPVAEEFSRVLTEVQLGKPRTEAFLAMTQRTGEKSLKRFANSILQIDTFGIPVSSVLLEQSRQMRAARRDSAREQGQKVPVKILGPIMLCFLPCVIAIVLGPAIITAIQAFSK